MFFSIRYPNDKFVLPLLRYSTHTPLISSNHISTPCRVRLQRPDAAHPLCRQRLRSAVCAWICTSSTPIDILQLHDERCTRQRRCTAVESRFARSSVVCRVETLSCSCNTNSALLKARCQAGEIASATIPPRHSEPNTSIIPLTTRAPIH